MKRAYLCWISSKSSIVASGIISPARNSIIKPKHLLKAKQFVCWLNNPWIYSSHALIWAYEYTNYCDVIMSTMESQITSLTIVYSTVYSGSDRRKHQSSASLAFVRGIHRWPPNSPHKGPVTRKMLQFDDVIMYCHTAIANGYRNNCIEIICECIQTLSLET